MGAARAAPDVSSEIWAAESSANLVNRVDETIYESSHTSSERPHGSGKGEKKRPTICHERGLENKIGNQALVETRTIRPTGVVLK